MGRKGLMMATSIRWREWTFPTRGESPDNRDAEKIYRILEDEIIPLYYNVSENGVPHGWVRLMRGSIRSSAARFSARRMVKQYIEKFYYESMERSLKE